MSLITVKRKHFGGTFTIGDLSFHDFKCLVLEDKVRGYNEKVHGKTAIPSGTYEIVVTFSNRFKRPLPLLLKVPSFDGVRIHPGNTSENTAGCLLVGHSWDEKSDFIGMSKVAFNALFSLIKADIEKEKVFIEIT